MKRLFLPWAYSVSAVRHLSWYVNYQLSGETRPRV
jgi:hypothetical protein